MSLSSVLSALGLAPKTLDQAKTGLDQSKAFAESVNALFTSAGLNLETLLAAGPESLKSHLESLSGADEALAEALLENERLDTELATKASELSALSDQLSASHGILTQIGVNVTHTATPDEITAAFSAHVAKQVTLANAKMGHPPVQQIDPNAAPAAEQLSDETHLAAYEKLEGAPARAYLAAHSEALWRADIARRTARR